MAGVQPLVATVARCSPPGSVSSPRRRWTKICAGSDSQGLTSYYENYKRTIIKRTYHPKICQFEDTALSSRDFIFQSNSQTKYNYRESFAQQMNHYQLLQVIDQGAYGIVYKARNKDNNRLYAIKKFKDLSSNPAAERLITRQITMLRNLRSKYIVEMKEVFRKSSRTYIVFQYAGRNLLKSIEEGGLKQSEIVRIVYQILKGLAFMHSHSIMHRDIKPENILLSEDKVKLCDFGFSRPTTEVLPTSYVATRWYRAPELLLKMPYGRPIDMWALGCLICEMIDGRPLFPGENEIDQLFLIQRTLGKLTEEQTQAFQNSSRFEGLRFPEIISGGKHTIREKFMSKVNRKLITLIEQCLKMNPAERMTPEQALCLPVFEAHRLETLPTAHSSTDIRKVSSIYNSHNLQDSISQTLSRRATNSLAKIPSIQQYMSTDLHFRQREHSQSQSSQKNKMMDAVARIYSKKLLTTLKGSG